MDAQWGPKEPVRSATRAVDGRLRAFASTAAVAKPSSRQQRGRHDGFIRPSVWGLFPRRHRGPAADILGENLTSVFDCRGSSAGMGLKAACGHFTSTASSGALMGRSAPKRAELRERSGMRVG